MVRMGSAWAIVAAVAAMTGTASSALGQGGVTTIAPPRPGLDIERLEWEASEFIRDRSSWARAAALLCEAAEARGRLDPLSAENLMAAGYLYYYVGDIEAALGAMRETGWVLLEQGDLDRAAEAMLQAAWIAERAGIEDKAQELAEWGALLKRPTVVQRARYQPAA